MTSSASSRFRAAMELVDAALDASPTERAAILAKCADADVRKEAERLLDADARAGDFLSEPAAIDSSTLTAIGGAMEGAIVGSFRLVSLLGKGGMGEVWIGERINADFEQRVAVKLLPAAEDDTAVARFRRERRILARLSHPRIAKLVDGGVTPQGRPWLAMELVDGLDLMTHCTKHALDIDARLRLFVEICGAVQFAHRNLVVHRDLKPSNVIVTPSGEPKLLDFGIAKLLEEEDDADLTREGERPMTLDYAAPEQVRGETVTTASDVWTLGVMLHELLTGVRPYRTTGKNRVEVERAILAAAPSRPSVSASPALRRKIRGDLDAIVLKAMRADPKDRYPSVEALGADVQHHLDRAPVSARGDATSYLIRAVVRRHRVAFAVSTLVIVTLVVGLVGTLWQARRAREEARKAEQAQTYLVSMLRAFDPTRANGKAISQRDILERGEARLDELDDQPEVQARLLQVFAETWFNLEEYDRARKPADRAIAIERRLFGSRSIEVAKTLSVLANIDFEQGHFAEAGRGFEQVMSIAREVEGPNGLTVAHALNDLAGVKRRMIELTEAEKLRRESLAIYERRLGERDPVTLAVMNDLAVLIGDEGRFAESAELQDRTCRLMTEAQGATHPDTLMCRCNHAYALIQLGRPAEADAILAKVHDEQVAVLGEDWTDVPNTDAMRARALAALGRYDEAFALFDDAIARKTRKSGADHPDVATILTKKSIALTHAGKLADAEVAARRALSIDLARVGENHAFTSRARAALGVALLAEGRTDEARSELATALAIQEKSLGPNHPETAQTRADFDRANKTEK